MSKFKLLTLSFLVSFFLISCSDSGTDEFSSVAPDMTVSESLAIGKTEIGMSDRQVIESGSLTLRVDEIVESVVEVIAVIEDFDGRIDDQSQYTDPTQQKVTSAYLLVRVPANNYDSFLDEVSELGNVEALNTSRTDVTMQSSDLEARIDSLENSVNRLAELVEQATNVSDLIAAESALAERQAELNGLIAQQKYLADQVDMASIYINLLRKDALDAVQPIGFWAGLEKGFQSVLSTLGNSTTFLGLALPWVILALALLVFVRLLRFAIKKFKN